MYCYSGDAQFQEMADVESHRTLERRAKLMRNFFIDPLSLNFGFTGLAVVIGWLILQLFTWIESISWG